jgi:hypothetical protein
MAQSTGAVRAPSAGVPTTASAPARIMVDPPLAELLSRGVVFIHYRTENLLLVPVFGLGRSVVKFVISPREAAPKGH